VLWRRRASGSIDEPGGSRRLRILLVSSVFPSRVRPTYGVFVRERARHVAALADVVVLAPVPWFPFNRWIRGREYVGVALVEREGGLTVYHPRFLCIPGLGKCFDAVLFFLSLLPFVVWLGRRFSFDLIDAHFTYPDGVAAALLGRVLGRPVVITVRGTHDIRHGGYALRRGQIRSALRAVAGVIAVSESLRHFVRSLGVRDRDVQVIPNGVDGSRFYPSERHAARDALGLPRDRVILLAVGGLVEGKGHHRVLEALPGLLERCPGLLYVAVGNGDRSGAGYRQRLDELVSRHGLRQHVRIVPARPHDEIRLWMAAADLFCLATRSEGWCNAIMEALACGLPVVTTRVGGNAELVREGRNGLLVPFWDEGAFRDAINQALAMPWDRAGIARSAAAMGWDRAAEDILGEFRRALGVGPGRRSEAVPLPATGEIGIPQ
jgi:teichuronic acid biosynthesis glycosyltransferase TuaC